MAVAPGIYNFTLQRRADFVLSLQFEAADVPIDLNDWSSRASIWNEGRTVKYADFTVAYVDRANGIINYSITKTQATALPDECFYDVKLIDPAGLEEYYLEGIIYVGQGYTE